MNEKFVFVPLANATLFLVTDQANAGKSRLPGSVRRLPSGIATPSTGVSPAPGAPVIETLGATLVTVKTRDALAAAPSLSFRESETVYVPLSIGVNEKV